MSLTPWSDELLSVPQLIEHLTSNGTMYYRQRAAYLLGQRGDPAATEALVRALVDGSTDVRRTAAGALATLRVSALPELVRLFQAEHQPEQRAVWLEQIVNPYPYSLPDPAGVECVYQSLRDAAVQVRQFAFQAAQRSVWQQALLTNHPDAEAVLAAGAADPSAAVRRAALAGFGEAWPSPTRVELVLAAMRDNHADVRQAAQELLRIPAWRSAVLERDAGAAWRLATDVPTLLDTLPDSALPARRWARVGLACSWHTLELLVAKRSGRQVQSFKDHARRALELGEQFLDGTAAAAELEEARQAVQGHPVGPHNRGTLDYRIVHWIDSVWQVTLACLQTDELAQCAPTVRMSIQFQSLALARYPEARLFETIRDATGNPFRPVAVDPHWLTSTVVDLTRSIDDDKAFDRIPILADALMDAGCDSDEIIHHCRGDGPHFQGCWVVDLLLGKS